MSASTAPTKVWTRLLGTSSEDLAIALSTGHDGSIYVAGATAGSLDGQAAQGNGDAFITKYDAFSMMRSSDTPMAWAIFLAVSMSLGTPRSGSAPEAWVYWPIPMISAWCRFWAIATQTPSVTRSPAMHLIIHEGGRTIVEKVPNLDCIER